MSKVLIGTPIIDFKEYSVERWMTSVRNLIEYSADEVDVFIVDNSDTRDFVQKLNEYAEKVHFRCTIVHLTDMAGKEAEERLSLAREEIRQRFLSGGYSRWLSWECDILVPPEALNIFYRYQEFHVVRAIPKSRFDSDDSLYSLDFGLFQRELLEKFEFKDQFGKNVDPKMPTCFHGGDVWFCKRIEEAGYSIADLKNLFPIEHLHNGN